MGHRLAPAPRATARSTARAQVPLVAAIQVLVMALWFSASAVVPQLQRSWGISAQEAGWLTSVVQIGFVAGALGSSTWNLPDRVPPRVLVGASSLVGTAATLSFALWADGLPEALFLRFVTGLALAGVYPVGMKVMVSWVERGRGQALGVLLAALTVGTGVPQLVRAVTTLPWQGVLVTSSGLAAVGGLLSLAALRLGPYATAVPPLNPRYLLQMFRDRSQRLINVAYYGHNWELYGFWGFLPALAAASFAASPGGGGRLAVGLTAFASIAVAGAAGCVLAGRLADRRGSIPIAAWAMVVSAGCSLLVAALFGASPLVVGALLFVWGGSVVADSAQFSAALSDAADPRYVGTALTLQTSIGFLVSVGSIQAFSKLVELVGWRAALPLLTLGPVTGAWAMLRLRRTSGPAESTS